MTESIITSIHVADRLRIKHTADLFGLRFPLNLEPAIYAFASNISPDYNGAYWEFYTLSNDGFFMAPHSEKPFNVSCENGFEGKLSPNAFGIAICLYAYSHLSFSRDQALAEVCAKQYHLLRDYMLEQPESSHILNAID